MLNSSNDDGVLVDSPLSIDPDEDRGRPNQSDGSGTAICTSDCGGALRPLLSRLGDEQEEVALAAKVER